MNSFTVLVSSAGRRCELLRIIRADAALLGLSCRIVATDMRPEWSAACHEADARYKVPPADDSEFVDVVADIMLREHCNLLVPTIDTELRAIAAMRDAWEAAHEQLFVLSHEFPFVEICRDKCRTMSALAEAGIAVPTVYYVPDAEPASLESAVWPLIAKPPGGSSSKGIRLVRNEREFSEVAAENVLLIQARVQGSEFTVNAYATRAGELVTAVAHRRVSVRGGEVEKGIVESLPEAEKIARRICKYLPGVAGPFNFQLIQTSDGECFVFEINARLGGGYPLAHRAGAHFTRWAIEEGILGRAIVPPDIELGWRMMRHDTSIFER